MDYYYLFLIRKFFKRRRYNIYFDEMNFFDGYTSFEVLLVSDVVSLRKYDLKYELIVSFDCKNL